MCVIKIDEKQNANNFVTDFDVIQLLAKVVSALSLTVYIEEFFFKHTMYKF